MTPLQRQVLDAATKVEREQKREQREAARKGNSMPSRNSKSSRNRSSQSSGMGREETTRYINKNINPNYDTQ